MFSLMTEKDKGSLRNAIQNLMASVAAAIEQKDFVLAATLVAAFAWLEFRAIASASISEEEEETFLNWYYLQAAA
jgi:hypothetical protein